MCGYCCGSTPVEKRGEGHKDCSEACYNAPNSRAIEKAKAAERERIALAIEAELPKIEGEFGWHDGIRTALAEAARIARTP